MEKWFDSTVYMQNKLAQMQATDPAYTMTQLVADFAAAGFVGEEGYFNHFMQFGAAEEVAPMSTMPPRLPSSMATSSTAASSRSPR